MLRRLIVNRLPNLPAAQGRLAFPSYLAQTYVQSFLGGGIGLLATWSLAPDSRGVLAGAVQLAYVVGLVAIAGFDRVSVVATELPNAGNLVRAGFRRVLVASALAVLVVGTEWSSYVDGAIASEPLLVACVLILGPLTFFARVVIIIGLRSRDSLTALVGRRWLYVVVQVLAIAVLLLTRPSSTFVWLSVGYVLPLTFLFVIEVDTWSPTVRKSGGIRSLRQQATRLALGPIAQALLLRLDRLLIAVVAPASSLGRYVALATISELVSVPARVLAEQAFSGSVEGDAFFKQRRRFAGTIIIAASSGALVVAAGVWGIPWAFGNQYRIGAAASCMLGLATAFLVIVWVQSARLAWRRPRSAALRGIPEASGLITSIIAFIVLYPPFDLAGAAGASVIGYGTASSIYGIALAMRSEPSEQAGPASPPPRPC